VINEEKKEPLTPEGEQEKRREEKKERKKERTPK